MIFEIPTAPKPLTMRMQFPNGVYYTLTLAYLFTPGDCWTIDIGDDSGNPIIGGIPLVAGVDMLGQYKYLGLGVGMFCTVDGDKSASPRWWNLGKTAHLFFQSPQA